jgi:cytochrome c oxidase subunit I
MDAYLAETYFVAAHFHFVMVGPLIMAYLGGLHFWWPKITGRMYPEDPAKVVAVTIFVGFFFPFGPQLVLGYLGMPRRYAVFPPEWQVLNVFSTAGATVMGFGYTLVAIYLLWSLYAGSITSANPWRAYGLEWETTSPPPTGSFRESPVVTGEAYDSASLDHLEQARQHVAAIGAD